MLETHDPELHQVEYGWQHIKAHEEILKDVKRQVSEAKKDLFAFSAHDAHLHDIAEHADKLRNLALEAARQITYIDKLKSA